MSLLVAKAVAAELRDGEVSLFSTESDASPASFTQEELFALSPAYSRLYARVVASLAPMLEARGLSPEAARIVLRDAVPTVVHLTLDRAMRLERFVAARGAGGLSVGEPAAPAPAAFSRAAALRSAAVASREFNESVLARLAPALTLPVGPGRPSPETPAPAVERGYINYNFQGRGLWRKVKGRTYKAAARVWPGRLPALGLSYATYILQDEGFFGMGGLEFVRGRTPFSEAAPEAALRSALRGALESHAGVFEEMLRRGGASRAAAPLAQACAALMAELFPADAWEGAPAHFGAAAATLAPFAPTALMLAETGNVESTFVVAAARARGFEVIGVQEGGHYGHEDDFVSGCEMEYPHYDRFVSWGWTRLPDWEGLGRLKAVPLPSPWLSEKRRQWERDGVGPDWWSRERPFDLLFMSNKLYPYPPAPSGGAVSRSDHAPRFAAGLLELVRQARRARARILHKSLNVETMRQLMRTLARLRSEGGDCYAHVERLDKGLHPALAGRARFIVWDQPGTGLLECLTAGLPTMVLWDRLYNRELPWSRPLFEGLERAGIVHRGPATLLAELARFKSSPVAWMRDPERARAVGAFCAEYARADDGWRGPWRDLLREACSRR